MYTMRFDLRPLRLTTGWSEPNAVVSRTLSVEWSSLHRVSIKTATVNSDSGFCHQKRIQLLTVTYLNF